MKRQVIRLLCSIYNESGINMSTEKRKIWRFVLLFTNYVSIVLSLAMSSIVNFKNFDEFVAPLTFLTASLSVTGKIYIIFHYRQTISRMLHEIDENLYMYPDSNFMDIEYPWYLREKNFVVAIYGLFILESAIITLMFCPSFIEMIFEHKISNFPYPTWTPWELESFGSRRVTLFLQVFQGFGVICVLSITLISVFVIVFEFLRQFVRLRSAVCSLKRRTETSVLLGERGKYRNFSFRDKRCEKDRNPFEDNKQQRIYQDSAFDEKRTREEENRNTDQNPFMDTEQRKTHQNPSMDGKQRKINQNLVVDYGLKNYDKFESSDQQNEIDRNTSIFHAIMRKNIISCIQHHQILYKNFQLFKIWYSKMLSLELAACVMTFFTGFFCLANASSASQMINYIAVAVIVNVNILLQCLIGETFSEFNNDIADVIFYDTDWREMNAENRRLLVLYHRILRRPFDLFGFSIIKANRVTFSKIIRLTYSSFNIVNVSLKKRNSHQ